jgi:hypothetical protein
MRNYAPALCSSSHLLHAWYSNEQVARNYQQLVVVLLAAVLPLDAAAHTHPTLHSPAARLLLQHQVVVAAAAAAAVLNMLPIVRQPIEPVVPRQRRLALALALRLHYRLAFRG